MWGLHVTVCPGAKYSTIIHVYIAYNHEISVRHEQ
jgi:hypothetical protein